MPLRTQYLATGQPFGLVEEDPGFVFADDQAGAARTRLDNSMARSDARNASAAELADRERQRQHEAAIAAYTQEQQNARVASQTQAEQSGYARRDALEARQQDLSAGLRREQQAQELSPFDMKDQTGRVVGKLPWSVLQEAGRQWQQEAELGERAHQFDAGEARRGYEFDTEQNRRGYEFEEGRRPSERDQFEADRRMTEMGAAQNFQMESAAAHANIQAQLNQQQLTQAEKMRLQRMEGAVAAVQADLDAGKIDPEVANDAMMQLRTGISPLKERQAQESALRQKTLDQLHYTQMMRQMHADQVAQDFAAKTFPERTARYTDAKGNVHEFYQHRPGEWTPIPDKQAEIDARVQQHVDTLARQAHHDYDAGAKELDRQENAVTTHWNRAMSEERRRLEKQVRDAKANVTKMGVLTSAEEKKKAVEAVAAAEASLDANLHAALVDRGYPWGASADEMKSQLLEARQDAESGLKARRDAQLERFRPQTPAVPQAQLPGNGVQVAPPTQPGPQFKLTPRRDWFDEPRWTPVGEDTPPPAGPETPEMPGLLAAFPKASKRMATLAQAPGQKGELAGFVHRALSSGNKLTDLPVADQMSFIAAIEELAKTEPEFKALLPLMERLRNAK